MAINATYVMINGVKRIAKPRDYVVQIQHTGAAGSIAQGVIQIDSALPFLLCARHMADTNDPTIADPGMDGQYENLVSVQDSSNNYLWSNDFIPRSAFARDRKRGLEMRREVLIEKNTKLIVSIKEPAAGAAVGSTWVTLQGWAVQ